MIKINFDKAKQIAHQARRAMRASEFAPLDAQAMIPSEALVAESLRQEVRERYAAIQNQIDVAQSVEQLKEIIQ